MVKPLTYWDPLQIQPFFLKFFALPNAEHWIWSLLGSQYQSGDFEALNPMARFDPGQYQGGGGGFILRALNCCLILKFGVSIEIYVQQAKVKQKFQQFRK